MLQNNFSSQAAILPHTVQRWRAGGQKEGWYCGGWTDFFGSHGLAFPLLHIYALFFHSPLRYILYVLINDGVLILKLKQDFGQNLPALNTLYISFCASNINYAQFCEKMILTNSFFCIFVTLR